ncbi:MAG: glycosyltransferase family 4 protein [Oryzomonas sp.]|uniref:glycosyltransferase family 4 protein n=1 Tax=Oryzomonas sp. TaxID=2855186 RepID=UPI0028497724|nr:glycosyltransferase family 4 protein [Oryzomonas sp.]MDR3579873.1 glycosyltransferase family 4 protein [Oryzomonas sp.]
MESAKKTHPTKPTIAVIVPKYGLVGGGERFAFEVTERMAREGRYEFHVFANRWRSAEGSPVIFHNVPTVKFPRFLRAFVFPWFAQRLVARGGFNLVHSHERIFQADIFSLHGAPHETWVRKIRQKRPSLFDRGVAAVERQMIKNGADSFFLPVSSITKEEFRRAYTTLPGTWQILHPGVDAARFSTPDRDMCRANIRGRYGIGVSDLLILFVGMNFETKGLDTAIAAVAKARTKRPEANIRLLVVGRGNEKKYAAICRSLGVAEAVTFAGTQSEGIEYYYGAADIFIMPSAFDTFGMVVLEAMATGLPVIISSNVGAKDVVKEGINGFILPDRLDADMAADRIIRLLDRERRMEMGREASRSAVLHDWNHLVGRMESLYQDILQRKKLSAAGREKTDLHR